MHRLSFLAVLMISVASMQLPSAPAPERKNAKPAVISAGTEVWIASLGLRIPQAARYAILYDKKSHKIALIRKHIQNLDTPQQKEWDAFDKWLQKNFRVERVKGKKIVRISFKDGNTEEQASIINVVVDFYLKNDIEDRRNSLKQGLQRLRDLKEQNRRDPQRTEEDLAKTDKNIKKQEERIRDLPELVERAKAR